VLLRERLAGKRLLITGVTGFVGEALLERLLTDLPEVRLQVLIRARSGQSGRDRLERLLKKAAFEQLRQSATVQELSARIDVVEGDITAVPPLPADVDIVIHCAGEVSFDPPIDEGFATNLGGLRDMLRAVREARAGRPADRPPIHFVHVSTAYVAGLRSGLVGEAAVPHTGDWKTEEAAALRVREQAEDASRTPEALAGFNDEAAADVGRAGLPAVSAEAERLRQKWVREQLVGAGRERARSLGWTDCYTMTKALGERYLEEHSGQLAVSVIRPSIIESALARPRPGWIEGFKMAEPIILAYGRGELPDFPAAPDGIIDIIPVDLVVNAILAAAATPPPPGEPAYYQVCSGTRNPCLFRDLYVIVRGYFQDKPLDRRGRGAVPAPVWSFSGSAAIEGRLVRGEKAVSVAGKVLSALPTTARVRKLAGDLDQADAKLRFLRRYTDLYRPYTQAELVYDDTNTAALQASLDAQDQESFGFDPSCYTWDFYLRQHCESITGSMRAASASPGRRSPRMRSELTGGPETLAVFDLDGTLVSSTVVESYLWLRLSSAPRRRIPQELAGLVRHAPGWLRAERSDRGRLIREVYTRYAGADPEQLARLVDEEVGDQLLSRISGAGLRRLRGHRAAGHRTVLITGAVEQLVRPLRPLFDEIVAAQLAVGDDGRCTGRLAAPPLVGEARAAWLRFTAPRMDAVLRSSFGYADSLSDLPMLQAVGHPVAVNPDLPLGRYAARHRGPVVHWPITAGEHRLALTR
jgi:HAD superfamily hydrolase (TIGR01490 family)